MFRKKNKDIEILLSYERHAGKELLKFPGGGVEHLEGPEKALVREFKEEAGCNIEIQKFFYVSPHFHKSYFRSMQLLGLYYLVKSLSGEPLTDVVKMTRDDPEHTQKLFWKKFRDLKSVDFVHKLDQEVLAEIQRELNTIVVSLGLC